MKLEIERYERIFLYMTVVVLVLGVTAIVLSVAEAGIHLPTIEERLDPKQVDATPPFDDPGVFETSPGKYEVVMTAETWAWNPSIVTVPAGSEVEFIITSKDIIHGMLIWDTNVNVMVIPGQVTRVSATFDDAGVHEMVCHEFCGIGHHAMFGRVEVTE